jgi:hypothetical protein
MDGLKEMFWKLCSPAKFYFLIGIFSFVILAIQNIVSNNYCVGVYECSSHQPKILLFLLKAMYILGWTWLLNFICRKGYEGISWFIVLFPFILMFIIIAFFLLAMSEASKNSISNRA